MELKDKRALPGLLEIISMDIDVYRNYDPDNIQHACIRNKIPIVGKAIGALLYISDGRISIKLIFLLIWVF